MTLFSRSGFFFPTCFFPFLSFPEPLGNQILDLFLRPPLSQAFCFFLCSPLLPFFHPSFTTSCFLCRSFRQKIKPQSPYSPSSRTNLLPPPLLSPYSVSLPPHRLCIWPASTIQMIFPCNRLKPSRFFPHLWEPYLPLSLHPVKGHWL